jgi:drug/metabolite transporter (DMT)-like permease
LQWVGKFFEGRFLCYNLCAEGQEMSTPAAQAKTYVKSIARVHLAMGAAVVALAFASIFVTELEAAEVEPLVIAFYRMAIATLLLSLAALMLRRRLVVGATWRDLALIVAGGFFLAVHFGAWIASLKYIPIAASVVLVDSHPIFVILAAYLFLGERPTRRSLFGAMVGFAGMVAIFRDGLRAIETALFGDALALLGAISIVGYFVIGRKMRARMSLFSYTVPLYAACSVFLFIWAFAAGDRFYPYDARQWSCLIGLALVPTIFGHTVFNWAISHVRASVISVAFLGEPVIASLLAFAFFGQRPSANTLIGSAFVLAGIYLVTSSVLGDLTEEVGSVGGSSRRVIIDALNQEARHDDKQE